MDEAAGDSKTVVAPPGPPPPPVGRVPDVDEAKPRRSSKKTYLFVGAAALAVWGGAATAHTLGVNSDDESTTASSAVAPTPVPAADASDDVEAAAPGTPEAPGDTEPTAEAPAPQRPKSAALSGATVSWSGEGRGRPRRVRVADDGVVVVAFDDALVGMSDGAASWTKEGVPVDLLRLQDGAMLSAIEDRLLAFDPATGETAFEVSIPAPEVKRGKPKPPPPVVAAGTFGSQVLVALADARFFVVDPPACTKKDPACLRPAGTLDGEYLEASTQLVIANDGTRFLVEDDTLRAFGIGFEQRFSLAAHSVLSSVTPAPEGRLALTFGGEVALLDVARCQGRSEVRLARSGATAAPKGCVSWRYGNTLDAAAPAVVDADTLAVNGERRLQVVAEGTDSWKSPLGSVGPVVAGAQNVLYAFTAESGDDGASTFALAAVDAARGTANWTIELPFEGSEQAPVTAASITMDWQPGWLAVALEQNIVVVALP